MSSVKNRILQFQQNETGLATTNTTGGSTNANSPHIPEFCTNGSNRSSRTPPRAIGIAIIPSNNKITTVCDTNLKSPAVFSSRDSSIERDEGDIMSNIPKKATLTINLSSSAANSSAPSASTAAGSTFKPTPPPNRPVGLTKPRTASCGNPPSGIPKLISPTGSSNCILPSKTPAENSNGGGEKLYGNLDWKEKYEEAERKRLHIVSLAQKATRDYEELRRRYQELGTENEKVVQRLKNSTNQLEALRNASEAAYHDYYKLKKHYQVENSAKSHALSRVDEYNKENRKLKRQSAALMQHFTEGGNFDLEELMEVGKGEESPENDKEIQFLRSRVQGLESRVVDLESELERTKLAEFESQEAAMLVNDSVQSSATELQKLKDRLRASEVERERMISSVTDLHLELESLKARQTLGAEKLQAAEAELRKVQTEKNVLQRHSVIFFANNTLDAQLQDALNQISELQFQLEEQKLNYETQILEFQEAFQEKESTYETKSIEGDAKVKSLESLVQELRERIQEAEEKMEKNLLEEAPICTVGPRPPPPPPPPPMGLLAPPPPPLPLSLNSSIQSVTLRRAKDHSSTGSLDSNSTNGSGTPEPKSIIPNSSAQIDDVVSQIKRGIKLRSTENRTMSRKETDVSEGKPSESVAIEEMRSILNNLKRTRRPN